MKFNKLNFARHVAGTKYPPNLCAQVKKYRFTRGDVFQQHFHVFANVIMSLLHVASVCTTQVFLSLQHVPATCPCKSGPLKPQGKSTDAVKLMAVVIGLFLLCYGFYIRCALVYVSSTVRASGS